ncbi:MAG: HEAT repeat domain-containing protein, partial [Candidatus Hodarchaeota archaeon]
MSGNRKKKAGTKGKISEILPYRLRSRPRWYVTWGWAKYPISQFKKVVSSSTDQLSLMALTHSYKKIRLLALSQLGDKIEFNLLIEFLEDPDGLVCREAIKLLGEL